MVEQLYWYNGELIHGGTLELAIDDPGLIYGATVFTTLRVYQHSLEHQLSNWTGHCERLQSSLAAFGWQMPDWERLRRGAEVLVASFPVLRIVVFADGREWLTGRFLPDDLTERQQQGITAWLADNPQFCRPLPEYKTGNYLPAWLALQKAQAKGAKEAILVDSAENWLETSTGNLWGWREGKWWTPPVEVGILPGMVRSQLISQNQEIIQQPWSPDLVKSFAALAYTNSVMEVVPIHTVLHQQGQLTYDPFHSCLEHLRSVYNTP